MVANKAGFDLELGAPEGWLAFASTQAPLKIWLSAQLNDKLYLVTLSQLHVANALGELGTPMTAPLPKGALAGRTVTDADAVYQLLRRAFQLSKSLPDELLHKFEEKTAGLPTTTEAERLIVQRIGQDYFRDGLIDFWDGRCAMTGLRVKALLRASHIKPWADCSSDAERLDIYNGLLLAPQLDAAFDRGFITVTDEGAVTISGQLDAAARETLGLHAFLRVDGLDERHRAYLPWHREKVFLG